MAAHEIESAAPAKADDGASNFDRLPGAVDDANHSATRCFDQLECIDPEALGIDPTECECAIGLCMPVVLHEPTWRRLNKMRVSFVKRGERALDALCVDEVAFLDGGRFEFCRNLGYGSRSTAIIFPARNECGDLVDIAAWHIETDRLALWSGRASMLGAENAFAPRLIEPLKVFETVPGWLRAGRQGVFVIDGARAAPILHMAAPLGVRTEAFGRRLREALTIRPPRIVVATPVGATA